MMDPEEFQEHIVSELRSIETSIIVLENSIDCLVSNIDNILSILRDDELAGEDWKPPGWEPQIGEDDES